MIKETIYWVCSDCGAAAKKLPKNKHCGQTSTSTVHIDDCDVCGIIANVAPVRDFGYPDFTKLIKNLS